MAGFTSINAVASLRKKIAMVNVRMRQCQFTENLPFLHSAPQTALYERRLTVFLGQWRK